MSKELHVNADDEKEAAQRIAADVGKTVCINGGTAYWKASVSAIKRTANKGLIRGWRKFALLSFLSVLAMMIQACAPNLSPQTSCNFIMSYEQQRVSWKQAAPVVLYIDSSIPTEFFEPIQVAAKTWNKSLGREVLKIGGWTTSYTAEKRDGANIIYFNKDWPNTESKKQAVTTVWWAGERVYEADISINGKNFEYSSGGEPIAGRVDFQSLILHEMGHVLGLEHPENEISGTVMARELPNQTLRRTPSDSDLTNLKCEY